MDSTLFEIEELTKTLNGLKPLNQEYRQKLDRKIRLEFNYNSNHIEGNTLTYSETELYLIFDKTTGNHDGREYEEMRAHDVAFDLIKEWAIEKERPLTEAAMKNLHEVLLVRPFWADAITPEGQPTRRLITVGDYKEFPNHVRLQNGEIFYYASPQDTPIKMGELIQWYRDEEEKGELHPVDLAALFHYRFVRIHPFDDGNGRMSRLLMNYILLKHDLPAVIIKTTDKQNYLFALNQADSGDLGAFVQYIEKQLVWSLELGIKAAKGESIEESDDIDKEIAIWKKNLVNSKTEAIRKTDKIVYEIYEQSISGLYDCIINKYKQFVELFDVFQIQGLINFNSGGDKEFIDREMQKYYSNLIGFQSSSETPQGIFTNINMTGLNISMTGFKKNGLKFFDIKDRIYCNFHQYKWDVVYCEDSRKMEKLYTQILTKEEISEIANDAVKTTFEIIKQKMNSK